MVGHGGPVFCLAPLAGDQNGLATGSYDATIKATPLFAGIAHVRCVPEVRWALRSTQYYAENLLFHGGFALPFGPI